MRIECAQFHAYYERTHAWLSYLRKPKLEKYTLQNRLIGSKVNTQEYYILGIRIQQARHTYVLCGQSATKNFPWGVLEPKSPI